MSSERMVGQTYGNIWKIITEDLFEERAQINTFLDRLIGIPKEWFKNKRCLDAGCGYGKSTNVMAKLGAREVFGVDVGLNCVHSSIKWNRDMPNTVMIQASVLALPFRSNIFDFVWCFGVLHHTPNPYRGFQELARVCAPKGVLSIGVYGKCGVATKLFNIFRLFARLIPYKIGEKIISILIPKSRIGLLDRIYVPIYKRFSEIELRKWLESIGYKNIERNLKLKSLMSYSPSLHQKLSTEWIQMQAEKSKISGCSSF